MQNVVCGLKIACEMKLIDMIADCKLQNPRSEIRNPRFEADCGNRNQKSKIKIIKE